MMECNLLTRNYGVENWRMRPVTWSTIAFARDLVLVASSERNLQYHLDVWNEELSRREMKINTSKIKTMIISRASQDHRISCQGQPLAAPVSYTHLDVYKRQVLDLFL